jgi:hypothetical protein
VCVTLNGNCGQTISFMINWHFNAPPRTLAGCLPPTIP